LAPFMLASVAASVLMVMACGVWSTMYYARAHWVQPWQYAQWYLEVVALIVLCYGAIYGKYGQLYPKVEPPEESAQTERPQAALGAGPS
jgi:hypothetical protein